MNTEFYIEGYRVDISADISSLLTYAIDDIKEFATRQTTFSKTIVLPGTANNNALLGNIFETGQSNVYDSTQNNIGYNFNAAKSARAVLFQDNLQTFKGTVRLLEIVKDSGRIEYEVALNGELTGLNVALSAGFLSDLDFSAYDQTYSIANIVNSWNNAGGSGLYYPHIDYGTYSTLKHNWKYRTFRPGLYVKELIDKMFTAANFRYDCSLFNTTRFKKLIVPYNRKVLTANNTKLLNQSSLTDSISINAPSSIVRVQIMKNGASVYDFTSTATGTRQITAAGISISTGDTIRVDIDFGSSEINFNAGTGTIGAFTTSDNITYTYAGTTPLVVTIKLIVYYTGIRSATPDPGYYADYTANIKIDADRETPVPIFLGDTVVVNDTIPQNIRQVDFLLSIVHLFNLYIYEDQFDERLIKITPYVDFYSTNSANAVDWTYKLNRDKMIKIKPMSELNSKAYEFNYKDDSDYYNAEYKKRYNQGYGSNLFDSQYEFASQTNKLELIFAPTPLVGYGGEDKVYSTIFKKSGTTEENIDSVIRILQTKKVTGVASWDILDENGSTVLGSYTDYGYAGHFDNPDNPQNDLNFGVLKELFFTLVTGNLSVTQFNVYWSSYMAEITDKDSKLLTANFYLTPKDIFELDFSKYVYLDGVLFRLNKIEDYNATVPNDCQVNLLKVINTIY